MSELVPADANDLAPRVAAIERHLSALDAALVTQDAPAMESASADLHACLADALGAFQHAAQQGQDPLSPALRQSLLLAQARVANQQALTARALAGVERTMNVLLPSQGPPVDTYASLGQKAANAYRG